MVVEKWLKRDDNGWQHREFRGLHPYLQTIGTAAGQQQDVAKDYWLLCFGTGFIALIERLLRRSVHRPEHR